MSTPDPPPDGLTDQDDFDSALSDLLQIAVSNDVDVRGGWTCEREEGLDLAVEIYRVADDAD
jgi:hypothetical protein